MEAMLESLIKIVNSPIFQEKLGLLCGIETEIQNLSRLLSTTKAVLEDAEQKQSTDKATQLWLQTLNLIAYEVDDMLDDYATEVSKAHKSKNICCNVLDCLPTTPNLWFRHRIGARMKKIIGKFDAVADERIKLGLSDQKHRSNHYPIDSTASRETGSLLNEPDLVLGRDEEKEKIVEILVNQVSDNQNVSVLPIVGVGGLGKTTLAQLLFNDERVIRHFEPKLWVWVSEEFDVKRIIQVLIVSAKESLPEALDFDPLQRKLQELLRGKRYLLVLDDVWNDNQEEWEKLKSVLACGSRGSSIVVTTRMQKVAEIMGTLKTRCLSNLSDDECWSLFRQRAFGRQEAEEYPNLIAIGKEIVKRCGGVPLAAKALGGFLRFKTEAEWNSVKCSELWNLVGEEKHILPALKLSYLNLPVELRGCFAYCAVFPKGYEIENEEVIHGWMANGLISSKGTMEVEDVGDAVLTELHYRSLLQAKEIGKFSHVRTVYKMHDLVHDLAQSVMEGKQNGTESDRTIRHLTLDLEDDQLIVAFPIRRMGGTDQYSSFSSTCGSLREFIARSTRTGKKFTELSPAISNLKHLRHLNLTGSDIVEVPNSICDLWNLQILNLNRCNKLRRLPKGMRFLRNLRHLCLEWCLRLTHMPRGIGKLSCLRTLSMVVLSDKKGFQLRELRDSNNLRGTLRIRQLERIEDKKDAEEANLIAKQSLLKLYLEWDSKRRSQPNNDEEVAKALQPCPNLHFLMIEAFKGSSFPVWISTLKNVVEIELWHCHDSTRLPVLGHLPHLQRFIVRGSAAEYVVDDDEAEDMEQTVHGGQEESTTAAAWFPSLKRLTLVEMPNLKGMLKSTGTSTREVFPRLQSLSCFVCRTLTSPLPHMLSLEELKVLECPSNMAWASISDLANLKSLKVDGFDGLRYFPEGMLQNLTSLQHLALMSCPKLETLPSSVQMMTTLQSLTIAGCKLLKPRCERGGAEWHKIKHIPRVSIN